MNNSEELSNEVQKIDSSSSIGDIISFLFRSPECLLEFGDKDSQGNLPFQSSR